MADIQVLPQDLADKIAAGEVAERPSAVVKELVENSMDAGADRIEVEIKSGGVEYIRVTDNGCGIPPEQAELAFMRHATSKLRSVDDLYHLGTMGFRGEALASICAVGEVELITKTKDLDEGRFLRLERGKVVENSPIGCADGTVMVVQRLFENIPARMKFLKKNSTEAGYVGDILTRIALSRPDIAFEYICDGKEIFSTTGDGKLENAILKVYGVDHAKAVIPVDFTENNIEIKGVVGKAELARGNRSRQTLFVNGRYIKSAAASKIVAEGYRNTVMKGKFPFFVLDIRLPRELVDVNVHPAKTEIKFADEKEVYGVLYHAVSNSIKSGDKPKPYVSSKLQEDNINYAPGIYKTEAQKDIYKDIHKDTNKDTKRFSEALNKSEQAMAKEYLNNIVSKKEYEDVLNSKKNDEDNQNSDINTNSDGTGLESPKKSSGVIYSDYNFLDDSAYETDKADNLNNSESKTDNGTNKYAPVEDNLVFKENETKRQSYTGEWDFKDKSSVNNADSISVADKDAEKSSIFDIDISKDKTDVSHYQESMDKIAEIKTEDIQPSDSVKIVGQIFDTYVLCQKGEEFWMIDQHASHERQRFERLKADYYSKQRMSQMLLTPMIIKLDYAETQTVLSNLEMYSKFGFEIEDFGSGSIIVNATPIIGDEREITDLILEIEEAIKEQGRYMVADFEEKLLDMIACKYAIKANHKLNLSEMQEVLNIVNRLEEKGINTCPHGRPIRIILTKTEIEKMFKRRV